MTHRNRPQSNKNTTITMRKQPKGSQRRVDAKDAPDQAQRRKAGSFKHPPKCSCTAYGRHFYCQECGKSYVDCKCKVYQSAYAKGRTIW
jgi:hypothetical protein